MTQRKMSKLKLLVESLQAKYVIVIENDFLYLEAPEDILGCFIHLNLPNKASLLKKLRQHKFENVADSLNQFDQSFQLIEYDEKLAINLLPTNIRQYLKEKGNEGILTAEIIGQITSTIEADTNQLFREILVQFGIFTLTDEYTEILQEIRSVDGVRIAFYKLLPTAHRLDEFKQDIINGIAETNSQFFLAIVDKVLEGSEGNEEGKLFVQNELLNQVELGKMVGLILTSQQNDIAPSKYEGYFLREVAKSSDNLLEELADRLAQAAYAEVFKFIVRNYTESSNRVFEIVMHNQKNIKHIVEKSHEEGIPAYDAIKYWFDLAIDNQNATTEVEEFPFIGGLTSFFNHHFLLDNPTITSISKEIKEINSFELFDYDINRKHLPIAPGDIWIIKGKFYILLGQLCDMLLRDNGSSKVNVRNSKIVELLPLEVLDEHNEAITDKYEVKVRKTKEIFIDYFKSPITLEYHPIKIEVSTPNIEYCNFQLLDLVMFNTDGISSIDLTTPLPKGIENVLPSSKGLMYEDLQTFFTIINQVCSCNPQIELDSFIIQQCDFSVDKSKLTYDIQRVGRLKGRYYDSLYNNYINNKSRVDLNLIDNSPELPEVVTMHYGFSGQSDTILETQATLWSKKGKEYFKRSELLGILHKQFTPLLEKCEEKIEKKEGEKKYTLDENANDGSYKLLLKVLLHNGRYHAKPDFPYKTLFNKKKPENGEFILADGTIENFLDAEGQPRRAISRNELHKGVIFTEEGLRLQLLNGIVNANDLT